MESFDIYTYLTHLIGSTQINGVDSVELVILFKVFAFFIVFYMFKTVLWLLKCVFGLDTHRQ